VHTIYASLFFIKFVTFKCIIILRYFGVNITHIYNFSEAT